MAGIPQVSSSWLPNFSVLRFKVELIRVLRMHGHACSYTEGTRTLSSVSTLRIGRSNFPLQRMTMQRQRQTEERKEKAPHEGRRKTRKRRIHAEWAVEWWAVVP